MMKNFFHGQSFKEKFFEQELLKSAFLGNFLKTQKTHDTDKVFVIGLDGADPDTVFHLSEAGRLPNITGLMKKGVYGVLESTIPPTTSVAWSSFMTGKNPGKTGVAGYTIQQPGTYDFFVSNSESICGCKIWDILGKYGKKSFLVNIPLTFPPSEINGFMIADYLAPRNSIFAYPGQLTELLLKSGFKTGGLSIKDYCRQDKNRLALTAALLKHVNWDFFMTVFTLIDRAVHLGWKSRKDTEAVLKKYEELDGHVGEILKLLDDKTSVFIVSDHGGKLYSRRFSVRNFLKKLNLIEYASSRTTGGFERVISSLLKLVLKLPWLRGILLKIKHFFGLSQVFSYSRKFVWQKTKAYSLASTANFGLIKINLEGREPEGLVSQGREFEELRQIIKKELLSIKDPLTDRKVVKNVYFREEIYQGSQLDKLPDIIFELEKDYLILYEAEEDAYGVKDIVVNDLPQAGHHRREGLFIARGAHLKENCQIGTKSIEDIFPTILYLLGLPVPQDIDGQVILEAVKDEYGKKREIVSKDFTEENEKISVQQTEYDRETLKRLRSLGYI